MVTRVTKKPGTSEPGTSTKLPKSKRELNIRIRSFREIYGRKPSDEELKYFVQGVVPGENRAVKPVIMPII